MQNKLKNILSIGISLLIVSSSFATNTDDKLSYEERRLFDYYFYEAQNAKAIADYASALDFLQQCALMDSTNADVNYNLGAIYSLGNVYKSIDPEKSKALNFFRKAVAYDSENQDYRTALALTSLEINMAKTDNRDFNEAIDAYEKLIKQDPEKIDLYLYLAEAYRLAENYPKAVEQLNTVEKIVGLNEKISMQKFSLYSLMNEKKKGFAEAEKYIQEYPDEIRYYIMLGNLYVEDQKYKEALAIYNKAKLIDENDPYLITSMANYYERSGNVAEANKTLHDALFNTKIDPDIKVQILSDYLNKINNKNTKDLEETLTLMDTLIVQHPQESQFNYIYGEVLLLLNKKDEARFQFQVFAESNPTNPMGWEQLIRTSFPDSLTIAKEVCEKAISYIPEGTMFYLYLSSVHHIEKDYKGALEILIRCDSVGSKENAYLQSELYGRMGDLYHQLEQKDSAFVYYDKALEYNPNNIQVLNNYSYYLSVIRKDLDRAEKMSSLTVKAEPTNPTYLDTYGWILFEQKAYMMAKIYLEKAVRYAEEEKDRNLEEGGNSVLLEHYGDVLYMLGEVDKAVEYWTKAKDGSESKTLDKKIETKTYIPE